MITNFKERYFTCPLTTSGEGSLLF